MNFVAIDFETANRRRNSACAIGVVVVENGQVVEAFADLIKPHDMVFEGMNIAIHGIRPEDVVDAPYFNELYSSKLKKYLDGRLVVAHNASFDMSVLRSCLDLYDIPYPTFDYLCTVKLAQKQWPDLPRHSLDVVSEYLGFHFNHHDAFDDAKACANVLVSACAEHKMTSPFELADSLRVKVGKVYTGGYKPCSSSRGK